MAVRIPLNQQITTKYTAGKEYMFNSTYREYIGHYYELNNRLFAGKEFNSLSPEIVLIQSDKINKLLTNPNTFVYGKISKNILLESKELPSIQATRIQGTNYLAKKNNLFPVKIIFISEDVYNENFQNNVLYSFTEVYLDQELGWQINEQNIKDIPEIILFLRGEVEDGNLGG
jgi:hypothetical protein